MLPKLVDHVKPQWPRTVPCKIAFVGEAPSDVERLENAPLVGPAGQVFNQILRTAGLDRSNYLITNVFDEQIPDNDLSHWVIDTKTRNDLGDTYGDLPRIEGYGFLHPSHAHHLARLQTEIDRVKPQLICPLGGTALWAFTGNNGITDARGAIGTASRIAPGIKILPMLHPMAVQHEWKMFGVSVADILKAARECEFPEIRFNKKEIWVDPSLGDLAFFKREYLDKAEIITVDIETQGGQIDCIGFSADATRAICCPFIDWRRWKESDPRKKPGHSFWRTVEEEQIAWDWVQAVLDLPQPKLFQNGPYDVFWLIDWAHMRVRNYCHDTRLLHHALYPELPKSLGFMGSAYANAPAWKLMREKKTTEKKYE